VTAATALLVALGAVVGAPLRYAVERLLASSYPWGTFAVNVAGSAVLGLLAGSVAADPDAPSARPWVALLGVGFCGALTTFGGFAAQLLDLAAAPREVRATTRSRRALGYAAVSVLACVAVAAAAYVSAVSRGGG
jgi:CrcB protein